MKSRYQRSLSILAVGLFVGIGTYNAVVINSSSEINGTDIKFVKRLDELYGVSTPGRLVAANVKWQKLTPTPVTQAQVKPVIQEVSNLAAAPARAESDESTSGAAEVAAIQEELELNLVEVINPKKWQQGLTNAQFSGSLTTNNGTIENLNVSLPNGEGVSVSFSDMSGNVFEYDLDGEIYSGMMYQVDQHSFMITLSNGPLEGTRLKFAGNPQQTSEPVYAQAQINNDNYGHSENVAEAVVPTAQELYDQEMQQPQNIQAQEAPPQENALEPVPMVQTQYRTEEEAANADLQFQQHGMQAAGFNMEQQNY